MNKDMIKMMADLAAKQIMTQTNKKSDPVKEVLNKIPNNTAPLPEKNKKSLFSGVGGILKDLAPVAASFIPGVGPIASSLLSTLNDDSWFEEYKSAGASFNEKLVTRAHVKYVNGTGANQTLKVSVNPRAAFATFLSVPHFTNGVRDTLGSSVIAYIRSKTNNVLTDNIESYYNTIDAALRLYAIHYSLEKWLKFAQNQPLNIPLPTDLIKVLAPENLNLVMGISLSLKQYLQATIKLPYPIVEALRWRFGTLFHTFNTGQPGYITYDMFNFTQLSATDTFAAINFEVDRCKKIILDAGRASADIKLAYDNHINRLDVENAHYDEKEFNLRHNIYALDTDYQQDNIILIKDSRLATSPAIQALTLSTHTNAGYALIQVKKQVDYAEKTFNSYMAYYNIFTKDSAVSDQSLGRLDAAYALLNGRLTTSGWKLASIFTNPNHGNLHLQLGSEQGSYGVHAPENTTNRDYIQGSYSMEMEDSLARSLGIYKTSQTFLQTLYASGVTNVGTEVNMIKDHISYDMANVSSQTVESIQVAALRNLFRGSMPGPKTEVTNADVKPQVEKILDALPV